MIHFVVLELWDMGIRGPTLAVAQAGIASAFIASVDALGVPWHSSLRRAKLPAERADPRARWPTYNILHFIDDLARNAGMPDLGVRVGQTDHPDALNPRMVQAIRRAPCLYAMLQAVRQNQHLESSHTRIWLCASQDHLLVRHLGSAPAAFPGAAIGEQLRLVRLIRGIRSCLGPDWRPEWLWLTATGAPPDSLRRFVGGCAISSGRPWGEVPIPLRLVACPMPTAVGGHRDATGGARSPAPEEEDWLERLKSVVASYLPSGGIVIGDVAEMAGMSVRTLQRQLVDRGTTYRDLLDGVRVDYAKQLLLDGQGTMAEIANAVGYTDSSNFARAFRRVYGRNPSQYRADLRAKA